MIREELERRFLTVLLALEDERRQRPEEDDGRSHPALRRGQPLADRTVADLVVVLGIRDEPRAFGPRQLASDRRHRAVEVLVVAVSLPRQRHVQRVVEAVEPHRVVTPVRERAEVRRSHLADHERVRVGRVDPVGQLLQHVPRRIVVDGVDGVEAQPVDAVVADPELRVLDRPFASAGLGVVERVAPGRPAEPVREVRPKVSERLAARSDVVVDDVEHDAEPFAVGRIHEPRQACRPAVGRVRRVGVEAVVSPAAVAGKGRHRHQLDRGDAELAQPSQPRDDAVEGRLRRERPDVELVEDEFVQREPRAGRDFERAGVEDAGRPADPFGLPPGARVGKGV